MATPNLASVSTITPKNAMGNLGDTNRTTMVDVTAEYAAQIKTILISNVDGTNAFQATVVFYDNGDTANYHIAKLVTVPAGTTLVVLGKDSPIYLEESDKITAYASAASDGQIVISYEEMDDA